MAHRAAIYTVRLKKTRRGVDNDFRYFGDPAGDQSLRPIVEVMNECFGNDFKAQTTHGAKKVRCESSVQVGDNEVHSMFIVGDSGQRADIEDDAGNLQHQLTVDQFQQVHCASVFRLDPDQKVGFWAVHLNNRHGAKQLIQEELARRLKPQYKGYTLKIASSVDKSALDEAITRNKLDKIKLRKIEKPDDRAVGQTEAWVEDGVEATWELSLKPKAARLKNDLLSRYVLRGDQAAWPEIVEFQGVMFDQAIVEVELGNGHVRSFNIEAPESGLAMTEDLTHLSPSAEDPSDESLLDALVRVIDLTTTNP